MPLSAQLVMLLIWWIRLVLALGTGLAAIVFVIDKWWLRSVDTAAELRKGNYAIAILYGLVVLAVLSTIR